MWLICILATALGSELTVGEPTDVRRYKVETYAMMPTEGKRYNLDWRPTDLWFWSALIECRRDGKRTDACSFVNGTLEFGMVVRGEDSLRRFAISAPPELEISYTKLGAADIDFEGKLDDFYKTSSDALLARYHKPENVAWAPDQQRKIGQDREDELRYLFGGAFNVVLPRDKSGTGGWRSSPPPNAQTWSGSTMAGQADMGISGSQGDLVSIQGSGRFSEAHPYSTNLIADGMYEVQAVWDQARGVPVATRTVIQFQRHVAGYFTQRLVLMSEANDDHTWRGGELEGAPIPPMAKAEAAAPAAE